MNDYAFEAKMQPDGSYIMSIGEKQYHCTDWADVCRKYHKHTEKATGGGEENHAEIQGNVH